MTKIRLSIHRKARYSCYTPDLFSLHKYQSNMGSQKLLIFTDMDGSLLDHYTYSHAQADPLLASLEQLGIPVIANTSKTRAELERLREGLNNVHPFIAENGAAVFMPKKQFLDQPDGTQSRGDYWIKTFVEPRSHWQTLIENCSIRYEGCYLTFAQAGVEGIVEMTGLKPDDAKRAGEREYGEPLKWVGSDSDAKSFFASLERQGANILRGGRFSHVSGKCDKGAAMNWLKAEYEKRDKTAYLTLALGDSQNDVAMLEQADFAVVIKSPVHPAPSLHLQKEDNIHSGEEDIELAVSRIIHSEEFGPEGWVEGVHQVLGSLDINIDCKIN